MDNIILTGSSGTGKTTIAKKLSKIKKMKLYSGYTTRDKRPEENYRDYYFINKKIFLELSKKNILFGNDWTNIYNNKSKKYLSHKFNKKNGTKILILPNGITVGKEIYNYVKTLKKNIFWIHLFGNNKKILEKRLKKRGDKEKDIKFRLNGGDSFGYNQDADLNIEISGLTISEIITIILEKIK